MTTIVHVPCIMPFAVCLCHSFGEGFFHVPPSWILASSFLAWAIRMWWNLMPVMEFQEALHVVRWWETWTRHLLTPANSQPTPRHMIDSPLPWQASPQLPCPLIQAPGARAKRAQPGPGRQGHQWVTWAITKAFCSKPFVHYTTIAKWITPTWA